MKQNEETISLKILGSVNKCIKRTYIAIIVLTLGLIFIGSKIMIYTLVGVARFYKNNGVMILPTIVVFMLLPMALMFMEKYLGEKKRI